MSDFICPFCKRPLRAVAPANVLHCVTDGVVCYLNMRSAFIQGTSTPHLIESFDFLREFKRADPTFAFSSVPLWDKDFAMADCLFVNAKSPSENVKCVDVTHLNMERDVMSKHLIAGKGMISDDMIKRFQYGLVLNAAENPLLFPNGFPDPDKILFQKILFESNPQIDINAKVMQVTSAYFQPTLEGVCEHIFRPFQTYSALPLTDEQTLYSWICFEPQVNIGFEPTAYGLYSKIVAFIRACLRDLDKVQVPDKIEYSAPTEWKKGMLESFYNTYYCSMPSTAINNTETKLENRAIFDILNHEFPTDCFCGYLHDGKVRSKFMVLNKTQVLLATLFDIYAYSQRRMGLEAKREFLTREGKAVPENNNKMLLAFWKAVAEYGEHSCTW